MLSFGRCISIFVAEAPAFLSSCHWGLASLQELSFSFGGEFVVGVCDDADIVDDDVGDGFGDGFRGQRYFHWKRGAVKTIACWLCCTELSGPWLVCSVGGEDASIFPYCCCCCLIIVVSSLLYGRQLLLIYVRR